jgi:hypothetical protein
MERGKVYEALDSERAYQESRWHPENNPQSKYNHSLEEWFTYMEDYIAEAKHILSRQSDAVAQPQAAAIMRKVTAMGVCALEQHGCERREGF